MKATRDPVVLLLTFNHINKELTAQVFMGKPSGEVTQQEFHGATLTIQGGVLTHLTAVPTTQSVFQALREFFPSRDGSKALDGLLVAALTGEESSRALLRAS